MSYHEQIYGEILDLHLLSNIINDSINKYTMLSSYKYNFYDFGSGYGKIVSSYYNRFSKCIGIEIVKDRFEYAKRNNNRTNVYFENSNFFDIKLDGPFVLLVNNLCFGIGTNKRLSIKLLEESNTNDIIIVTKKLTLLNEYYRNFYLINCTWGESEIYIYVIKK